MKAATIHQLKQELKELSHVELVEISLRLGKFKKENKELLTYLLFDAGNEEGYVKQVKGFVEESFQEINSTQYYFMKKSIRKILRNVKKYIRYSKNKETEVQLLLHFCQQLKLVEPSIYRNTVLHNMFIRQHEMAGKKIKMLHEDLQYEYDNEWLALMD